MMTHRIELGQLGIGGVVLVVALIGGSLFIGPDYVSRGIVTDTAAGFLGRQYTARVECDPNAAPPTVLEALNPFAGNKARVRAYSSQDADTALREAFPGCEIGYAVSEGRPGWMRLLSS